MTFQGHYIDCMLSGQFFTPDRNPDIEKIIEQYPNEITKRDASHLEGVWKILHQRPPSKYVIKSMICMSKYGYDLSRKFYVLMENPRENLENLKLIFDVLKHKDDFFSDFAEKYAYNEYFDVLIS